MTTVLLMTIFLGSTNVANAQPEQNSSSWVIWPSGAVAFPTGRFGEKDETSPPKDGHGTGYSGGLEAGYFLSDFLSVGLGYSTSQFPLDALDTPSHTGNTSAWVAQAWGRFCLRSSYRHWQPYLFAGVGIGRPKASVEYDPPANFGLPATVTDLEITVDVASSVSGGVGVLVPITNAFAFSFEPRYTSINSKGAERVDLFTLSDGSQVEAKEDDGGNRLKDKSDTNWWELRFGLTFLIR